MNKKTLLLDMDGLVVLKREVFSLRVSKKLNIPWDDVLVFFKNEFQDCLVGKADLKEELAKYTLKWGWTDSVDELLKFWFEGEKDIDDELVNKVSKLRKDGYKVYIATNNEKYRCDFLWNKVGLKDNFDGIFSSAQIGHKKPDLKFYLKVLTLLQTTPSQVIFYDDDAENIASAKEVGIDSRLYSGVSDFKV